MNTNFLRLVIIITIASLSNQIKAQFQPKCVSINKSGEKPTVDGKTTDDAWLEVESQIINVPFSNETVSFSNSASFKAIWNSEYIYILVEVPDDDWFPISEREVGWQADKPELYIDVNTELVDGGGPDNDAGHYQITPAYEDIGEDRAYEFAYLIDSNGASYNVEYAIPFTFFIDNQEVEFTPEKKITIGFDITVRDIDEPGKGVNEEAGRINWSNNSVDAVDGGVAGESWHTLDQAGIMHFSSDGTNYCNSSLTSDYIQKLKNPIEIFPNPSSEYLQIRTDEAILAVRVLNLYGAILIDKNVSSKITEIDVSELSPGYYIVEINVEDKNVSRTVLIE